MAKGTHEIDCWVTFWKRPDGEILVLPDTMCYSKEGTKHKYKKLYSDIEQAARGAAVLIPLHKKVKITAKF